MAYVSLTLIHVKSVVAFRYFYPHAYKSYRAAKNLTSCLDIKTTAFGFYDHSTMSLWDDKEAMLAFLVCAEHKAAMKSFDKIGTGCVYGYEAPSLPDWSEARKLLEEHGRTV